MYQEMPRTEISICRSSIRVSEEVANYLLSTDRVRVECYCGNDNLSAGKAPLSECSMICGGNKNATQFFCGGTSRMNVYFTTQNLQY